MRTICTAFLLLAFLFSACETQEEGNKNTAETKVTKKQEKPIYMSTETELKSAEYLTGKIKIPTAVCAACEENITNALKKVDGIIEATADADKKIVTVTIDGGKLSFEKVKQIIAKTGYDADDVKRNPDAYEKLDDCCKTERTKKS